ncbi:MAG TPA: ImmA/IrrE family metallo-endopeptidase [Mucilaginibacter sp.]
MNTLLIQAIKKAGQIRTKLKLDMFEPANIFDICADLGVSVRFIDVSMEGMYVNQENAAIPTILLSSLRPMPRRVFTCAHELGHHIFGHGSKIDGLTEEGASANIYDNDEYLVDAFAGAFLMPIAGVEAEFSKRNLEPKNASPIQFYIISSIFGTGYSTLITHCRVNRLINELKATSLLKQTPAKLLQQIIGTVWEKSHFKIIDNQTQLSVIDLEVGNYLFLPEDVNTEGKHLRKIRKTDFGNLFIAEHPGITRAITIATGYFIRIQNAGYTGLAEYRHLENNIE